MQETGLDVGAFALKAIKMKRKKGGSLGRKV